MNTLRYRFAVAVIRWGASLLPPTQLIGFGVSIGDRWLSVILERKR